MVIEHGITVAGKPLKDHLEAIDHFEAIRYVRNLARQKTRLVEMDVRNRHRLVTLRARTVVDSLVSSYAHPCVQLCHRTWGQKNATSGLKTDIRG